MSIKMLNLILPVAIALLAIFTLAKDWEAHKEYWRRLAVLFLIILMGFGGAINNYYIDKKNNSEKQRDQSQISGLKSAVETANKNQQDNTEKFLTAFSKMSQELSNLKTQASTEKFRQKVDQLQTELESTQKALNPPKSSLIFSFAKSSYFDTEILKAITLPAKDNIVHVDFVMLNRTQTTANNVGLSIYICSECEFASEPNNFQWEPGTLKTQRLTFLPRIFAKTRTSKMSADIRVPANFKTMQFAVLYRCDNCDIAEQQIGVITLSR